DAAAQLHHCSGAVAALHAFPARVLRPILLEGLDLFFSLHVSLRGVCRQKGVCAAHMARSNTPCGLFLRYKNKALHRLTVPAFHDAGAGFKYCCFAANTTSRGCGARLPRVSDAAVFLVSPWP